MEHTDTLCGQNAEFSNIKADDIYSNYFAKQKEPLQHTNTTFFVNRVKLTPHKFTSLCSEFVNAS
jgi:hypothetical protein